MDTNQNAFAHYLGRLGISQLNSMQLDALASSENNNEHIILSATGSGKTLAFLLPIIQAIDVQLKTTQALILVPSRELALQIEEVLKQMQTGFKTLACYGGHKREIEENSLVEAPTVIIATAGRMADHIRRGNIKTDSIGFLVLDEFDKMLELGFVEEMEYIIKALPHIKKRTLTSATNNGVIPAFVAMENPVTLNYLTDTPLTAEVLRIHTVLSPDKDKLQTLLQFLCYANDTTSIIFCNHRDAVERTSEFLNEEGIVNVFYHGGMEQRDREVALCKFRNGTANILVTTDLASRGLDIANIRNIVHYHLPLEEASFTHRNGRTARMGNTGNVYVIYSYEEKLPAYITETAIVFDLPERMNLPDKPKWSTLFIDAGKKDKISKSDIVGFLSQKGDLKKDDLGLIEVKDFFAFAAVRKSKAGNVLENIKEEKLKGRKIKIAIAK